MKNKNKKVLIICPFTSPNQGGVESHIQKLTTFLGKKKQKSIIISYQPLTTPTKAPFYEKNKDYEIYRMPWFGNGLFPKIEHNPLLTFFYLVPGILLLSLWMGIKRSQEISVIHAHGFAAAISAIILKKIINKRLVMSTHAIYDLANKPLLAKALKLILSQCDYVLAVGEPSRQEIINIGIPASRVAVHPNWVDTDFFSPGKGNKGNNTQVIFVGRGLEKKGIFLFGELAKKNPKINFVARVGDGPDLNRFINKFKSVKNLSIRTKLSDDFDKKMATIQKEYKQSDIFIMPSLYDEGFASVVLEASSSGLAMISSNLGCLPDMLKDSGAILIKPTLKNFDQALKKLIKNKKFLQESKKKIRNHALKVFSPKNAQIIYNSYNI